MARKKRKKISNQHSRQEQRKLFNSFKRSIKHHTELLGCPEIFTAFDENVLFAMYRMRSRNLPRLKVAKGLSIDRATRENIFSDFRYMISDHWIKITDQYNASVKDTLQYLLLIDAAVQAQMKRADDKTATIIHKYRMVIPDFQSIHDMAYVSLLSSMLALGVHMSRMHKSLCWLERIEKTPEEQKKSFTVEIKEHIPKKQMMIINGRPRPVYPLAYALIDAGPLEASIPAKQIKLPSACDKTEIPVFSQNHLLHRLSERLDIMPSHYAQFWLFMSFKEPKLKYYMNEILVEYIVDQDITLGYIVLEFQKDRLLAKTFLLLSQLGTPEGTKLKEMSGIEKQDVNYWAIDKLSTFQKSDLKDHPKTRALFEDAGCGDLFKELPMIDDDTTTPCISQAKQFLQYLQGSNLNPELRPPDHIPANSA